MQNKTLDVYYKGKHVGTLAESPERLIAFQYSDDWLKTGFSLNPLNLPLKSGVFLPPDRTRQASQGLFGVFNDSLPDSWGTLLMDRKLQQDGIDPGNLSAIDRLAYIGASGMGALEYHPSKRETYNIDTVGLDYDQIAMEVSNVLSSKPTDKLDLLYELGASAGGTRPKILLHEDNKDWIVKFPANSDYAISGKCEYDYSVCAKKCGIAMTQTELVPSKLGDGYFKTERFDRKDGQKIYTATAAGLLDVDFRAPTCDYETYMKLVKILTHDNQADKKQMFSAMCFNVLTHNRDDHTKNISFIFDESAGWRLSPMYDLTYSDTFFGEQPTSVNGKGKDITDKDFIEIGKGAGLSESQCATLLNKVRSNIPMLSEYLDQKGVEKVQDISWLDRLKELSSDRSADICVSDSTADRPYDLEM